MSMAKAALLASFLSLAPLAGLAQPEIMPAPVPEQGYHSPVLTLDQDRLYIASRFGERMNRELEAASQALASENRQIEAELIEEERALTELRANLPGDEFRARAEAFDAKVESIRTARDAKARELARLRDSERQRFFESVLPVLDEIVRDMGAAVILDNRAVLLSVDQIDITDEAIARINAAIGTGDDPHTPPASGGQ